MKRSRVALPLVRHYPNRVICAVARLLSHRYERKIKCPKREFGLAAAEKRRDAVCEEQVRLDNEIIDMPATARRDIAIKLAIYRETTGRSAKSCSTLRS